MRILNIGKAIIRRKSDGKYLMLRGSVWPERPDRSQKPDLPGGAVEDGESIEEGCIREVMEEAGIKLSPDKLQLVHSVSFVSDKDNAAINRLIYFAEIDEDPEIRLSWEHEAYEWLTPQEVLDLEMRKPYPELFKYLNEIGILV